jgi:hypothetical protein
MNATWTFWTGYVRDQQVRRGVSMMARVIHSDW